MGAVNEIDVNTELCTKNHPALVTHEKMCLHYVIHYIKRGYWQNIIPELTERDKQRIEAFQCNVCKKKFRNNHAKGEYPGRGSFICHWATEHGKLVEAMKTDPDIDMSQVMKVFEKHDERVGDFIRNGTKTKFDKNPVKEIESITWRIQQGDKNKTSQVKPIKQVIKCPKCSDCDRNKDVNNLKLHIFHHYLDFWKDKIPEIEGKEIYCDQCSPEKKIVGANPEGCRTSFICHRAIHHNELRDALELDPSLPEDFIEKLFGDGEPAKKKLKVLHTKSSSENNSEDVDDPEPNISKEKERIAEEVRLRTILMEKKRKLTEHERMLELEKRLDEKLKKNKGI